MKSATNQVTTSIEMLTSCWLPELRYARNCFAPLSMVVFRWLSRPYVKVITPELLNSITIRLCRRMRHWVPIAAIVDLCRNSYSDLRHICFVRVRRRVNWKSSTYTKKARAGKLSVSVPVGHEKYGVDGIRTSQVLQPKSWIAAAIPYSLTSITALCTCVLSSVKCTDAGGACPNYVHIMLCYAGSSALLQFLVLDLMLTMLRVLTAEVIHNSRWQRVSPGLADTNLHIQRIFRELGSESKSGYLGTAQLLVLLKRLNSSEFGAKLNEIDIEDAVHDLGNSSGRISLTDIQNWWKIVGSKKSKQKGVLRSALHKFCQGEVFDSTGTATVTVWKRKLEIALAATDQHRQEVSHVAGTTELQALADQAANEEGGHESEELSSHDDQDTRVGIKGHTVNSVSAWVGQHEAFTHNLCEELLNPFNTRKLTEQKRRMLNTFVSQFHERQISKARPRLSPTALGSAPTPVLSQATKTANRMQTIATAVAADVRLRNVWLEHAKAKIDLIKDLYDQDLITPEVATDQQSKILTEIEATGVHRATDLGYVYDAP